MTSRLLCISDVKRTLAALYCSAAILLSGCSDKEAAAPPAAVATATATPAPTATTPSSSTSTSPTAPTTTSPTTTTINRAPAISGVPSGEVTVGASFAFTPTTSDRDSDALTFQIVNKPEWTAFNTLTGKLTGTPDAGDVGTYEDITISVSDGKTVAALPQFDITVVQTSNGAVTLSWMPPTSNTDGSTLSNLAGYKIHYGTDASQLTQSITISNASLSTYVVENLSPATWYFAIKAYSTAGVESDFSAIASKKI